MRTTTKRIASTKFVITPELEFTMVEGRVIGVRQIKSVNDDKYVYVNPRPTDQQP